MIWSVYQITHAATGMAYTGRTTNQRQAWWRHKSKLKLGKHVGAEFQAAWDFYLPGDFKFEVIAPGLSDDASSEMVRSIIADHESRGVSYNPSRSDIISRRVQTATAKNAALSAAERRAKWGRPGNSNHFYGKRHDEAARAAMSEAAKARTGTRRIAI